MILARFDAPEADEGHGVDEVGDGGGANRSNFVLLGKYYLLKYLIMSLIIIIYIHDLNFFSWFDNFFFFVGT
jgi:hypothetical protein